MEHSRLGASIAHRWINCAGSVSLCEGIPSTTSVYAREGLAAHEVAARALRESTDADAWVGTQFHGVEVTDEMAEHVQVFLVAVREAIREDPDSLLLVEQQFTLQALNPPEPMFGTSDAEVYQPRREKLVVFDLKYGKGVAVEVPQVAGVGCGFTGSRAAYTGAGCEVGARRLVPVLPGGGRVSCVA